VIDEIDRLNPHVQERLLQFLERGDVQPIGARHRFRVDVRLIACSNGSLRELRMSGCSVPIWSTCSARCWSACRRCANAAATFRR
jgi:transcriptional regulator with AAA-type ATPase domain